MEEIRHITCTHCHWSLWTEEGAQYDDGRGCRRCGSPTVVGQRPDDSYPSDVKGSRHMRESDPQIAILDTQPA